MSKRLVVAILCGLMFSGISTRVPVLAQDIGAANHYSIKGTVTNGNIISFRNGVYSLSSETYDKSMFGVVSTNPAIELKNANDTTSTAVLSTGITNVLVSSKNGPIKEGDIITSSDIPGVGMKSTKSGFILGVAQASYDERDPSKYGLIPVSLTIKFAFVEDSPNSERIGTRLLDVIKLSTIAVVDDPVQTFRYVLGGGIVILSLLVTFFTVAKTARNGVDAIGRNPLAAKAITAGIVLNVFLSLTIAGAGLVAAYVITTL